MSSRVRNTNADEALNVLAFRPTGMRAERESRSVALLAAIGAPSSATNPEILYSDNTQVRHFVGASRMAWKAGVGSGSGMSGNLVGILVEDAFENIRLENNATYRQAAVITGNYKVVPTEVLSNECAICYERTVSHFVKPCMHGYMCQVCATKCPPRSCAFCRGQVESVQHINPGSVHSVIFQGVEMPGESHVIFSTGKGAKMKYYRDNVVLMNLEECTEAIKELHISSVPDLGANQPAVFWSMVVIAKSKDTEVDDLFGSLTGGGKRRRRRC